MRTGECKKENNRKVTSREETKASKTCQLRTFMGVKARCFGHARVNPKVELENQEKIIWNSCHVREYDHEDYL